MQPLEVETVEQPRFRVVWNVVRHSGVFYIHIPHEFAALAGIDPHDLLDLSIWRVMKRPHGEKKK